MGDEISKILALSISLNYCPLPSIKVPWLKTGGLVYASVYKHTLLILFLSIKFN